MHTQDRLILYNGNQRADHLVGALDPSAGAGVPAEVGSTYQRTSGGTGELWLKTGAADTAWSKTSTGGGGTDRRTATLVVGNAAAGDTINDCDFLYEAGNETAIQDAIDALPVGGGSVHIKRGTYTLIDGIDLNKDNAVLQGEGTATILTTDDSPVVSLNGNGVGNLVLRDMLIQPDDGGVGVAAQSGQRTLIKGVVVNFLQASGSESGFVISSGCAIEDCVVLSDGDIAYGIDANSGGQFPTVIERFTCKIALNAIRLAGLNITVRDSWLEVPASGDAGIRLNAGGHHHILNNTFLAPIGSYLPGIKATNQIQNMRFEGNQFYCRGFDLQNVDFCEFINNIIGSNVAAGYPYPEDTCMNMTNANWVIIRGNRFYGYEGTYCIYIGQTMSSSIIDGNHFVGDKVLRAAVSYSQIINNFCFGTGGPGTGNEMTFADTGFQPASENVIAHNQFKATVSGIGNNIELVAGTANNRVLYNHAPDGVGDAGSGNVLTGNW